MVKKTSKKKSGSGGTTGSGSGTGIPGASGSSGGWFDWLPGFLKNKKVVLTGIMLGALAAGEIGDPFKRIYDYVTKEESAAYPIWNEELNGNHVSLVRIETDLENDKKAIDRSMRISEFEEDKNYHDYLDLNVGKIDFTSDREPKKARLERVIVSEDKDAKDTYVRKGSSLYEHNGRKVKGDSLEGKKIGELFTNADSRYNANIKGIWEAKKKELLDNISEQSETYKVPE